MRLVARVLALGWLAALDGCERHLPSPGAGGEGGDDADEPVLSFVPAAPLDAAPAVSWLTLRGPRSLSPDGAFLFEGTLSTKQAHDVANGKISKTLAKRAVDATSFLDADAVVVAPEQALAPGDYTVVVSTPPWSQSFHVADETTSSLLRRVWPPDGLEAGAGALVFCGPDPLPSGSVPIELEPARVSGDLVSPLGSADECMRFVAGGEAALATIVPPPEVTIGATAFAFEPGSIALADLAPTSAVVCANDEEPFGVGCASVLDDRVLVRTPSDPMLWIVGDAAGHLVRTSTSGATLVVRGLTPLTSFSLDVLTLDRAGRLATSAFGGFTKPPMTHLVLNEVYPDALGPEPAEEWLEIYNDGTTAASLSGMHVDDAGGPTPLPDATIAPGAFALVVPDTFVADDGYDVPVPEDCPLLRVPKLGTSGLSNGGELLRLVDGNGEVLSAFPALPKPKPGISVARVEPDAPDDAPSSFALSAGGASPCAANLTAE